MKKRDDFIDSTKRKLAIRAAHFCSHPDCMKLTAGPHSDPDKSLQTGHAAHIKAAAPGGARYDDTQTVAERKSMSNGIWMCRECGDLVDKDAKGYTVSLLKKWKREHEKLISSVRTKGYAESLRLLSLSGGDRAQARAILLALSDRRSLWEAFDAESPDRVRKSLDHIRDRLSQIRVSLEENSPLDVVLATLTDTIILFFRRLEKIDLTKLKCNSTDPNWICFSEELSKLRKGFGLQIFNITLVHNLEVPDDLKGIVPEIAYALNLETKDIT